MAKRKSVTQMPSTKAKVSTSFGNAVTGDKLEPYRAHIASGMFHGFDFDATMLRIAAMNLILHGVEDPDIHYQDTLSTSFTDRFPQAASESSM